MMSCKKLTLSFVHKQFYFLNDNKDVETMFHYYVNSIGRNSNKVFRIITSSNISDHWKEKIVPVYAFILLKNSLLILGILFLIILVFSTFIVLSSKFLTLILSITGVVVSIVISLTYLKLRVIFLNE